MPRRYVAECLQHRLLHAGMFALQLHQQPLRALALQSEIAAGRAAAPDNRQLARFRVGAGFLLSNVDERPDDYMPSIVRDELRRHRRSEEHTSELQSRELISY